MAGTRGRRSAASKQVARVTAAQAVERLPVPVELSDYEAAVWEAVTSAMPADWFDASSAATLVAYCKHVATARVLDEEIAQCDPEWLKDDVGLDRFDKLTKMRERETRAITACARSMRLTQQAQMHPRTAGRQRAGAGGGRKPWQTA